MRLTSFFIICFFSVLAFSSQQSSYELSCRAKAKEIAAETYRTCVTENKSAEIDRLKKDYQERLRNLKNEYETEISKLGLKKNKNAAAMKSAKSRNNSDMIESKKNVPYESDDSQMDLPEPIPVEVDSKDTL